MGYKYISCLLGHKAFSQSIVVKLCSLIQINEINESVISQTVATKIMVVYELRESHISLPVLIFFKQKHCRIKSIANATMIAASALSAE